MPRVETKSIVVDKDEFKAKLIELIGVEELAGFEVVGINPNWEQFAETKPTELRIDLLRSETIRKQEEARAKRDEKYSAGLAQGCTSPTPMQNLR